MEYRILGPLEVLADGEAVDVGPPQQRALLAILLLRANRVASTERILEDLWPDDPQGKEQTLWVYISRLRSILDPDREGHGKSSLLVTRDHGYTLVVQPDELDAERFERFAAAGRERLRDDPEGAARRLHDALDLWRGAVLEDFVYDDFAQAETTRLEELRLSAVEDRVDADLRLGRHREVLGELERLVVDHPHRERFVAQLMIALYRAGRQADAVRAFERHRHTIGEELGIEPSPGLRRVQEQVLLHDARLQPPTGDRERPVSTVNPFNGLHAFTEADVDRFFGRDRLVADLVRRITRGDRLVALVGASGSGKSSVLNAGLLPAIRKGAVPGSDQWPIARMVPGAHPFREAEAALARATLDPPRRLADVLTDPDDGLLRACLGLLPEPTSGCLLVIDQFEELFTLDGPTTERTRFIRNLEVVLDDPDGRVVVAIALRADLYGRPLEYPRFAELFTDGLANVVPLTPDELETAAEEPARRAGVTIEPALLVQLLGDVAGQPGRLPLFQYALTELFDRRDGALLTLDAYREMGGVSGAIARRAEDLLLAFEARQREVARQLFLRLVAIGEQGAWERRRLPGAEVVTVSDDLVALQAVLNGFAAHRLLTLDRDPVTDSPTVELAHEALLDRWPRLRRWIEDGRQDLLTHTRLATALAEWEAAGRQPGYLLTDQRLADYERWAAATTLHLATAEQTYLDDSIRQRESARRAEQERADRERRLDRTARRRLWAPALVALALVAGAIGTFLVLDDAGPAVAVVHGVGGDRGAADLMIAGVGAAEREHDLAVDLVEPLVDAEEDLRRLAEAGTDLVVVGGEFDLAVDAIAPQYPDVQWVAIDPAAVHVEAPNLTELHFAVQDSAFLAGVAAALTTDTGKVGFVGGYQTFRTEQSRNGFEQGVEWIDPDITVASTYLGPVTDPVVRGETRDDLAQDLADIMYDDGADVIFHDAGAAGLGVTRAALQRSDADQPVWTIGSDVDEYLALPEGDRHVVLTSTEKRFDTAVASAVSSFLAGDLVAGEAVIGLADDGVALSRSGGHLDPFDGRLRNLEGDLEVGHITVSPHAWHAPDWQSEPDLTLELTLTDDACTVDQITGAPATPAAAEFDDRLAVERDGVVIVELANATTDIAGLAVRPVPPGTSGADLEEEARISDLPPNPSVRSTASRPCNPAVRPAPPWSCPAPRSQSGASPVTRAPLLPTTTR